MNTEKKSLRLDAYIRVSQVGGRQGDSFISVVDQEDRVRHWAAANGHEIIAVHHELDVSGGTMDRPLLNEVMARIDAGDTDGVVVYNLSRFARTLVGSIELIHRINERGALFASVSDGFDVSTVTGRMVLGILLSIAQAERERSQENWRTARGRAVERNIHISAPLFGYLRRQGPENPRTGLPSPTPLEVDPETGSFVTEIFRRRAAGEPWSRIRDWLTAENVPTVRGKGWSSPAISAIVSNTVYLGIARGAVAGDFPGGVPGAHPALIDEATWHQAQVRTPRATSTESPAVSRGLVRCAGCRYTAGLHTSRETIGSYRMVCARAIHNGDCQAPMGVTLISPGRVALDDVLTEQMWAQLDRIEFEGLDESLDVTAEDEEIAALEARLDLDMSDTEREAAVGRPAWTKHLAGLAGKIGELQGRRAEKLRLSGRPNRPSKELRADWESGEMPMADKRALMASVIQMVFVKRVDDKQSLRNVRDDELRRQRLLEQLHIVWVRDGLNVEIPRQGGHGGFKPRPFVFPSDANPDVAGEPSLQL
jgi:DNA invertase Pin-like site-specific DNA recombinase